MNCKRFFVLIAAAATLPLAAQIPDTAVSVPTLSLSGAGAPAGSNASVEAALRQALLGKNTNQPFQSLYHVTKSSTIWEIELP